MPKVGSLPIKIWIGIDPGASGGLAAIVSNGWTGAISMPDTCRGILEWIRSVAVGQVCHGVIEQNSGYVGGTGNPGSGMFKFGISTGQLEMALAACGIPFEQKVPGVWQRALGVPSKNKGETKTQFKNRLKKKAQEMFPNLTVTLSTADALLIALYCKRKCEGTLNA